VSVAPPGTKVDEDGEHSRSMVLSPVTKVAAATTVEPSEAGSSALAGQLDEVVHAGPGGGLLLAVTPEVESALGRALSGEELEPDEVAMLVRAVERATDSAVGVTGVGLLQAASLTGQASALLESVDPAMARCVRRKPLGKLAGLRISRRSYDRSRAYRFNKNYGRWIPYLTAWDATLRFVAAEARIRARFKPGLVLNDDLVGLAASSPGGGTAVYIHPDRFAQVAQAHREPPLAVAAFLHGVAVHELSHVDRGRMG